MSKVKKQKLKALDTPLYKPWEAVYRSFYSIKLYKDVFLRWKGCGFLYLLLATVLLSIPISCRFVYQFNYYFKQELLEPILLVPEFTIQNGEVILNKPSPYILKDKQGHIRAIMDTTDKMDQQFYLYYPELVILINKHSLMYKAPPTPKFFSSNETDENKRKKVYQQKLDKTMNGVYSGRDLIYQLPIVWLKYTFIGCIFLLVATVLFTIFAVCLPVFAMLGQVIAFTFFSFSIHYKPSCRLMMVGATPMITFLSLMLCLDWTFPVSGVVLVGLLFFYYCFGITAAKNEQKKMVSK